MSASQAQRVLAARAAAYTRWSRTADTTAATNPMRDARMAQFEKQVDPDGTLTDGERNRRALQARKAFMADIARRSVASRRAKTAAKKPGRAS